MSIGEGINAVGRGDGIGAAVGIGLGMVGLLGGLAAVGGMADHAARAGGGGRGGGGSGGGGAGAGGGGGGPRPPQHHIFAQNASMYEWFWNHGIRPHDYTVPMDTDYLRYIHEHWIHGGSDGGLWNREWREFIDSEPPGRYSADEIWAKAKDMMERYNIPPNYRRY
jgi:hypothetical protein